MIMGWFAFPCKWYNYLYSGYFKEAEAKAKEKKKEKK
jgi:hypothetical protein